MRILAVSYAYAPSIGGIESITRMLTDEWLRAGHEVRIVTHTEGDAPDQPCPVFRRPDRPALEELHDWADVVWHNNISLTFAWPALRQLRRKPWVVTHQGEAGYGRWNRQKILKHAAFHLATNVSITRFIQGTFGARSVVIPNPYDHRGCRILPGVPRDQDAVFLGRLVSDKGADLAIQACAIAARSGSPFRLTIIGRGPEEPALREQAAQAGLGDSVRFTGALQGDELVRELNRHRVMLVPSKWNEPFGIVALEGAACGLVVVGPKHGGLPEAIGPCGPLLDINDPEAWAQTVSRLCASEEGRAPYRAAAPAHLARHTAESIAQQYVDLFESLLRRR
ncbi:MAG: glycosyltransferase [Armatimonadetes bacterium]|nr:glycosyltransferase [Armatimonadota bacterium]MCA1997593.1 glycosyltransferase [Armatimonadota bacterium]